MFWLLSSSKFRFFFYLQWDANRGISRWFLLLLQRLSQEIIYQILPFLLPQPSALVVFPPWVSVFHLDQSQGRTGPLEKWPRMMYSVLITMNSAKKESFKEKKKSATNKGSLSPTSSSGKMTFWMVKESYSKMLQKQAHIWKENIEHWQTLLK